ncbi:hypothetical protein CHISP_1278 [Chitinispirillum alkaliphilum]|nr:hypothetical protein CHISP_1278 [Chitinispirillum alkaliphilum]
MTGYSFRKSATIAGFIFAFSFYALAGNTLDQGKRLLESGDVPGARDVFARVVGNNPSDTASFLYARTLDTRSALKIYDSLSRDPSVTVSVRAKAYCLLGDYAYSKGDKEQAARMYMESSELFPDPFVQHRFALSSYLSGDTIKAFNTWNTLALGQKNDISKIALFYLAMIQLQKGDYQSADHMLSRMVNTAIDSSILVPFIISRYLCARNLGYTGLADSIKTELIFKEKTVLERKDTQFFAQSLLNDTLFTVQIGAFGVRENAEKIKNEVKNINDDVTIVRSEINDQILYRVRTGTFFSREEAGRYSETVLSNAGFTGRVVEKQIN